MFGRPTPAAKLAGMVRVGDHPAGHGKVGVKSHIGESDHPEAGGLWAKPSEVDKITRRHYNDAGLYTSAGERPKSRGQRPTEERSSRRMEDCARRPGEHNGNVLVSRQGGKIGYNYEELSAVFIAYVKRAKARAQQEMA